MTDIKPGDKFNIRHEQRGDGQWVWSGTYECEGWHVMFGGTQIIYKNDGETLWVWPEKCVKVD